MLCPDDIVTPVSRYLALTCQAALHRQLSRQNVTETVAIVISVVISRKLEQQAGAELCQAQIKLGLAEIEVFFY